MKNGSLLRWLDSLIVTLKFLYMSFLKNRDVMFSREFSHFNFKDCIWNLLPQCNYLADGNSTFLTYFSLHVWTVTHISTCHLSSNLEASYSEKKGCKAVLQTTNAGDGDWSRWFVITGGVERREDFQDFILRYCTNNTEMFLRAMVYPRRQEVDTVFFLWCMPSVLVTSIFTDSDFPVFTFCLRVYTWKNISWKRYTCCIWHKSTDYILFFHIHKT